MRRITHVAIALVLVAYSMVSLWFSIPNSSVVFGFFVQAMIHFGGTAVLSLMIAIPARFTPALDAAAGRIQVPVVILSTLLASGMVAISVVATSSSSTEQDCLSRSATNEILGLTAALSFSTLFLSLSGLAFAAWHSWISTVASAQRRWLTACVFVSTGYALVGFPLFLTWIFAAVEC